ncbi:MAG: hypothetical protein FWH11_03375 [Micrococcales bacterium]|nr:hypothetical protein [Micrococcales bacterium]
MPQRPQPDPEGATVQSPHWSGPRPDPQARARRAVLAATAAVAVISTGSAYGAMVQFAQHAVGMSLGMAVTTAGVLELALVTAALLAREAAQQRRPTGVLLTLTWLFSSLSGLFAAWHELYQQHPVAAAGFRAVVPLLAALLWHLALLGDRHLATGQTWHQAVTTARVHRWAMATEQADRARAADDGTPAARRRTAWAERAARRARSVVLRTVPPDQVRGVMTTWLDALAAVSHATGQVADLAHHTTRRGTAADPVPASPTASRPGTEDRSERLAATVRPAGDRAERARALRAGGATVPQIAAELDAHPRTVHRWLAVRQEERAA